MSLFLNEKTMQSTDEHFMQRCFELAQKGAGRVAPNPMVGAVLVFDGKIIGEGWHEKYGEAHAEVNCFRSVLPENECFLNQSTLFCSLEPCHHFGKTPPCVDLILEKKVPRVVLSNADPNPLTAGKSIQKLRLAGVEVIENILEKEGARLNRAFFKWILERKPFVILKWAESADGFLGRVGEATAISSDVSRRLSHRWRSEIDAILVGTATALTDDPSLTTRLFLGKNPARLVIDFEGKVPKTARLFSSDAETVVVKKSDKPLITNVLEICFSKNWQTLMIEGGSKTLQQFIDAGTWDEARVFISEASLGSGIWAPKLENGRLFSTEKVGEDRLLIFEKAS